MTRNDRKLIVSLMDNLRNMPLSTAVESMWKMGFLNKIAIEKYYIHSEVNRRVRAGETKTRAIAQLSSEMDCSYEKVRAAVYCKQNQVNRNGTKD